MLCFTEEQNILLLCIVKRKLVESWLQHNYAVNDFLCLGGVAMGGEQGGYNDDNCLLAKFAIDS